MAVQPKLGLHRFRPGRFPAAGVDHRPAAGLVVSQIDAEHEKAGALSAGFFVLSSPPGLVEPACYPALELLSPGEEPSDRSAFEAASGLPGKPVLVIPAVPASASPPASPAFPAMPSGDESTIPV